MDLQGHGVRLLSTGLGRCTCSYFFPDGRHYLYASTHQGGPACPPLPDMSHGYVWALYKSYDIFVASLDDPTPHRITDTPGYDAEATISPRGDRIVFTSVRDGDLELSHETDGGDVRRITPRPATARRILLADGVSSFGALRPASAGWTNANNSSRRSDQCALEICIASRRHGRPSTDRQWPTSSFFHPRHEDHLLPNRWPSRQFRPLLINLDGSGLGTSPITEFDGFPMWSPDGRTFVFCSNRHNSGPHQTNVFLADWVE
jgi:Tol biopolymer transport system component